MNDFDTLCDPLNSSKFYKSSELTEFTHSELDSGIRKLRPMKKLKSLRPQKRFKRTGSIAKAKSLVQLRRANAWKRLKLRDQPVRVFQEENENTMKQSRNVRNYRLKEGNSVSGTLPPTLDSFLQDIAQITGMIDYTDIMNFGARATAEDVKKLRKLYKAAQEAAEYDDEDDYNDIARDVRKVVVADEEYHHPNYGIDDCSCCGSNDSTDLLQNYLRKSGYDVEAACDILEMDPCEVVCKDCYDSFKPELDSKLYSEYNDLGIDTRTGEPFGESRKRNMKEAIQAYAGNAMAMKIAIERYFDESALNVEIVDYTFGNSWEVAWTFECEGEDFDYIDDELLKSYITENRHFADVDLDVFSHRGKIEVKVVDTDLVESKKRSLKKNMKEGFYTDDERAARGLDPSAGGGICNHCKQDVAGGDYYDIDLDSTREMILEAMLKEFGCRNCYMGEYEAANWLGISDDELDDWIHEVYDYMSEDSDYLCRNCMYTEVTKAIKAWHEDNWDSEDDLDESYKRDRTLDEGRAKPYVVVKIRDEDDTQAETVLASYGGQLDYCVWEIARNNIDDIKEEIPNWQKRLSFYTSYDCQTGAFGSKCRSKEFKAEDCNAPRGKNLDEAYSDEDLDMDETEWLEKMKAERNAQIKARQAKRDAEAKAKADAERIARGDLTPEEKAKRKQQNLAKNWRLLEKYAADEYQQSCLESFVKDMAGDLADYFAFDNPYGYQPYGWRSSDYEIPLIPVSLGGVKVYAEEDEDGYGPRDSFMGNFDYYSGKLTYYPVYEEESLNSDMTAKVGQTEADDFHSGVRNVADWKKYMIDGEAAFETTNDIHDTFDMDAELFACFQWKVFECLNTMLVAASIQAARNDFDKAREIFAKTPYASRFGTAMGADYLFFEGSEALFPEDYIESKHAIAPGR